MKNQKLPQISEDIFNSMSGFLAVDAQGKIVYIGKRYAKNLGLSQEKCIGRPVNEVITNTRMKEVLANRQDEIGQYMSADGSIGQGTVCNRLVVYREGDQTKDVVGAVAFGIITGQQDPDAIRKEMSRLQRQNELYQNHLAQIYQADRNLDELVGVSDKIQAMKDLIRRIANTAVSVCILGETGTGKELVANAIHKLSQRNGKPFVKINCAAIPKDLMESELFGYEPGAFTGALRQGKIGKFELANQGTLLLDEIGELPLSLQAKLLRVLQAKEVERVGGAAPVPIDVRLICSTNRDLLQMIKAGSFRADLYYRINTMEVRVPPLRERPEDIPMLATLFIEKANERNSLAIDGIDPRVYPQLVSYSWPGNVRELEHGVERACVLCGSGRLQPMHFSSLFDAPWAPPTPAAGEKEHRPDVFALRAKAATVEKEMILQALDTCGGRKSDAAELLNITRATLYRKLKKYQISL